MSMESTEQMVASINGVRIQHRAYKDTVSHIHSQANVLVAGEIMIVVGPSRVGKDRAISDAMNLIVGEQRKEESKRPVIYVSCENSQADGEFSTRGFMLAACRAINHPIYANFQVTRPQLCAWKCSLRALRKHFSVMHSRVD
jgi:ABC-type transport system involved in resistance to organic solvents, ATPase component